VFNARRLHAFTPRDGTKLAFDELVWENMPNEPEDEDEESEVGQVGEDTLKGFWFGIATRASLRREGALVLVGQRERRL
jgi:hypothetical protein